MKQFLNKCWTSQGLLSKAHTVLGFIAFIMATSVVVFWFVTNPNAVFGMVGCISLCLAYGVKRRTEARGWNGERVNLSRWQRIKADRGFVILLVLFVLVVIGQAGFAAELRAKHKIRGDRNCMVWIDKQRPDWSYSQLREWCDHSRPPRWETQ